MSQQKATRAKINLTNSIVVTGWMVDEVYYASGTDAGRVIDKDDSSILYWVRSEFAKGLSDKDKSILKIDNPEGKGGKITLYTTACVREYWCHWAFAGNVKAQTIIRILTGDSLEHIYDEVFRNEPKSKQEHQEHRTFIEQLEIARDLCKARHQGFQLKCVAQNFAAHAVHNRMTLKISGMDATLARELEMILKGDKKIGLNHYHPEHELALRQLAVAKRIFTGARIPGFTWQEQVDRAVDRAQKEVST